MGSKTFRTAGLDQLGPTGSGRHEPDNDEWRRYLRQISRPKPRTLGHRLKISSGHRKPKVTLPKLQFLSTPE